MSKPQGFAGALFSAENANSFVGSTFSILVGMAFLVAAITFKGLRPGSETLLTSIDANLIYYSTSVLTSKYEVFWGQDTSERDFVKPGSQHQ